VRVFILVAVGGRGPVNLVLLGGTPVLRGTWNRPHAQEPLGVLLGVRVATSLLTSQVEFEKLIPGFDSLPVEEPERSRR
jgi:hypothetical protein